MIVLFLVTYNLFLAGQLTQGALLSFSIGCALSSVLILTGTTLDVDKTEVYQGRLSAFGADPNLYARILMVGVVLCIGIAHARRERPRVYTPVMWALAALTMAAVGSSASRGVTLATILGLGTLTFYKGNLRTQVIKFLVAACICSASTFGFSKIAVLRERWELTLDSGDTSGRMDIYREALGMVADKLIIGWGPDATTELADRLGRVHPKVAPHNSALTVLIYAGLLGALPWLYASVAAFVAAWRGRKGVEGVLPLALFVAMFLANMGFGGMPEKVEWILYSYQLAAGSLVATVRSRTLGGKVPGQSGILPYACVRPT